MKRRTKAMKNVAHHIETPLSKNVISRKMKVALYAVHYTYFSDSLKFVPL